MLLLLSLNAFAQQRPVFSQYMFNGLAINPAYAGSQKQLSATALYRDQWVNFDGAPTTKTFSIHSGFRKRNIGLGLMVYNEQIGVHSDLAVYASYAYKIEMPNGVLSMGIQGGFNNLESNYFKLSLKAINDPVLTGDLKKFNPNFGTGLFYSTRSTYIGLSVPFLINNKIIETDNDNAVSIARESRYYFLTAGKVFDINEKLKIKPSTLLRVQEGAPLGVDLNVNFFIDNVINLGTSYRSGDSMIFLFELALNENFSFGYAYDLIISDLNRYSNGSHEIMINYRLNHSPEPCHTYF